MHIKHIFSLNVPASLKNTKRLVSMFLQSTKKKTSAKARETDTNKLFPVTDVYLESVKVLRSST